MSLQEGGRVVVEAVKLTMVWQILQAAITDVSHRQPVVVLATCSRCVP